MSYTLANCSSGSLDAVTAAVRARLLPAEALKATEGMTKTGRKRAALLGAAISHLQVLKSVVQGHAEYANILESSEVVHGNYTQRRDELMHLIYHGLYLANLDAEHPTGLMLKLKMKGKMKR